MTPPRLPAHTARGAKAECLDQAGDVVGLFGNAGRIPPRRSRTSAVAAAIKGDGPELIGEAVGDGCVVRRVHRAARDEHQREPGTTVLVVEPGTIDLRICTLDACLELHNPKLCL